MTSGTPPDLDVQCRHVVGPVANRVPVVDLIGVMVRAHIGGGEDREAMVFRVGPVERHFFGLGIVRIGIHIIRWDVTQNIFVVPHHLFEIVAGNNDMLQAAGQRHGRWHVHGFLRRQIAARQTEDAQPAIRIANCDSVVDEDFRGRGFRVHAFTLQVGADRFQLLAAL